VCTGFLAILPRLRRLRSIGSTLFICTTATEAGLVSAPGRRATPTQGGAELTKLTPKQAEHVGVPVDAPFEHDGCY